MTLHDRLMLFLIAEYLLLAMMAAYCRQTGKCVYWIGAIVLSIGVLLQK